MPTQLLRISELYCEEFTRLDSDMLFTKIKKRGAKAITLAEFSRLLDAISRCLGVSPNDMRTYLQLKNKSKIDIYLSRMQGGQPAPLVAAIVPTPAVRGPPRYFNDSGVFNGMHEMVPPKLLPDEGKAEALAAAQYIRATSQRGPDPHMAQMEQDDGGMAARQQSSMYGPERFFYDQQSYTGMHRRDKEQNAPLDWKDLMDRRHRADRRGVVPVSLTASGSRTLMRRPTTTTGAASRKSMSLPPSGKMTSVSGMSLDPLDLTIMDIQTRRNSAGLIPNMSGSMGGMSMSNMQSGMSLMNNVGSNMNSGMGMSQLQSGMSGTSMNAQVNPSMQPINPSAQPVNQSSIYAAQPGTYGAQPSNYGAQQGNLSAPPVNRVEKGTYLTNMSGSREFKEQGSGSWDQPSQPPQPSILGLPSMSRQNTRGLAGTPKMDASMPPSADYAGSLGSATNAGPAAAPYMQPRVNPYMAQPGSTPAQAMTNYYSM